MEGRTGRKGRRGRWRGGEKKRGRVGLMEKRKGG